MLQVAWLPQKFGSQNQRHGSPILGFLLDGQTSGFESNWASTTYPEPVVPSSLQSPTHKTSHPSCNCIRSSSKIVGDNNSTSGPCSCWGSTPTTLRWIISWKLSRNVPDNSWRNHSQLHLLVLFMICLRFSVFLLDVHSSTTYYTLFTFLQQSAKYFFYNKSQWQFRPQGSTQRTSSPSLKIPQTKRVDVMTTYAIGELLSG